MGAGFFPSLRYGSGFRELFFFGLLVLGLSGFMGFREQL